MSDAAAFDATYSDFKLIRSRKCVQIVLEIPLEKANIALQALGGMPNPAAEIWVGVARLNNQPEETAEKPAPESPGPRVASNRMTTRAAILCIDPVFQRYLKETYLPRGAECASEESAAELVRLICKVKSRSEILPGSAAGEIWEDLHGKYIGWRAGLS